MRDFTAIRRHCASGSYLLIPTFRIVTVQEATACAKSQYGQSCRFVAISQSSILLVSDRCEGKETAVNCYFQGCAEKGTTKEHIPPRSFFPDGEKTNLLTVRSCEKHNGAKSKNDLYVLAQICMNASPSNRAREVFSTKVAPQLSYNDDALRNMLLEGSYEVDGGIAYPVNVARFDEFFTALACGLIYKSQQAQLPSDYRISHIYHRFVQKLDEQSDALVAGVDKFYDNKPLSVMAFGNPNTHNERIYTCEIHGLPKFQGSITIVHRFFEVFKVTSMLSRLTSLNEDDLSQPTSQR